MESIAILFNVILAGLRVAVAEHTVRDRPRAPILVLAWGRIGRMAQRFEALFNRWRAGTLPKPRPSRAGQARAPREHPQPPIRLPQGRTWLVAIVGYQAAGRGSQLQHLMAQPDMAEFLEAVPQTGRILRPLCHMLGIPLPTPLVRAGLPRKSRPRKTARPPRQRPQPAAAPKHQPRLRPPRFSPA